MKELKYTTIEEQIAKLREQNLTISNEEYAKSILSLYGYSNLIKSFRDPYIYSEENGESKYRSGTNFEQIVSLYLLDKNLRDSVMSAMLDLEEHIKVYAADTIASSFGIDQRAYLEFRHYRDKKKKKNQFSLSSILKRMGETLNTDKDPIRHYSDKYGIL